MKSLPFNSQRVAGCSPLALAGILCALVFVACMPLEAGAQTRDDHAPPVMKFLPPEDRARLTAEGDVKRRVQLALEMADMRLQRAAQLTTDEQYDRAATELGIYQGLIEDTMRFLEEKREVKNGKVSNRFRDIYKRVELSLRAHGPRLETIRRSTPSEDAVNVRAAYDYIRQARADALNSFYGETVLRESSRDEKPNDAEKGSTSGKETSKDNATQAPPEKKEQP